MRPSTAGATVPWDSMWSMTMVAMRVAPEASINCRPLASEA